MSKSGNVRLHHMLDAANKILAFTQGRYRANLPPLVERLEELLKRET
ncbi:hypothetical protein [Synechococcus sp. PCC 7336]|nr:hypothetical protein [Synechococcus sp. PCC 7336]